MTINHHILVADTDEAVVFAELFGFTCSICAPTSWTAGQVIEHAEREFPSKGEARWVAIDKSELGLGSPTPNPCNQYPEKRMHWFMMRGET